MPRYEIWLQGNQRVEVEGDALEHVPQRNLNQPADPRYTGYNHGDVLVRKGDRIVAWYKRAEIVGYNEQEPPSTAIA